MVLNRYFSLKQKKQLYIYIRTFLCILAQGGVNSVITEDQQQQQQENLSVPIEVLNTSANQTFGGVQTTTSFHSVSSADSTAEMSKYFPDAQTPELSPFR